MKSIAFIIVAITISLASVSQVAPKKYFISFTDKYNSAYSTDRPQEFLTERAIERRTRQGIAVVENDIPVNPVYINTVRNLGVTVLTVSKWFNGISIYAPDSTVIQQIESLPFVSGVVKSVIKTPSIATETITTASFKFDSEQASIEPFTSPQPAPSVAGRSGYNYGQSFNQIHMVKGDILHNMGYTGDGMVIAILDGGFFMANTLPAFDSLRINHQLLGTRDFVVPGNNVYIESPHGMEVLSIIGGNLPGQLVGTAPKAKFWLLRSEDIENEYLIEEYNWVSAAEFADSVGADVINSSLGYTTFTDPSMNHSCTDMTGNTTPVSQGANLAFSKGMIVVNSAGNSGSSSWKCVSAPADAFMVLAVAAVDSAGLYAGFSSTGKVNERVKPNIAAQGKATVLSAPDGSVSRGNGTSFSSPVIAGMVACLWQAARNLDNKTILRAVEISASQANNPDSLLGYGIPDFDAALFRVGVNPEKPEEPVFEVYPNPFSSYLTVRISSTKTQPADITLFDIIGKQVVNQTVNLGSSGYQTVNMSIPYNLVSGSYLLKVVTTEFTGVRKICK